MKPLYEFLFPIVSGGEAKALVCRVRHHPENTGITFEDGTCPEFFVECCKVVRTRQGMIMHLKRVHRIKIQLPLFGGSTQ